MNLKWIKLPNWQKRSNMGYCNNPIDTTVPKCSNPEKDCNNLADRTHRLIEKDESEKGISYV